MESETPTYIAEGNVKLLSIKTDQDLKEEVFYNPVQVFNRDLSLLVTYVYAKQLKEQQAENFKGIKFYDALSATGWPNKP